MELISIPPAAMHTHTDPHLRGVSRGGNGNRAGRRAGRRAGWDITGRDSARWHATSRSATSAVAATRSITTTTHTRVLVGNTKVLVVSSSRRGLGVGGWVNSKADPSHDTVLDGVANHNVLDEGVHGLGLLGENAVVGVESQVLGVGVVRCGSRNLGKEVLVQEDLANVRGVSGEVTETLEDGAVGADNSGVGIVAQNVNVGSTTGVVTGDDGLELSYAVDVGGLDAAEEGVLDVGHIVLVAVTRGGDSRVDTSGVAVPEVNEDGGDRLASAKRCQYDSLTSRLAIDHTWYQRAGCQGRVAHQPGLQ